MEKDTPQHRAWTYAAGCRVSGGAAALAAPRLVRREALHTHAHGIRIKERSCFPRRVALSFRELSESNFACEYSYVPLDRKRWRRLWQRR